MNKVKKLLFDIRESIDSIEKYLGPEPSLSFFQQNKMLRRAVERELEIIGEATNKLLKIDANIPIKDARRIVSLRNFVIHAYDDVDAIVIWGILQSDLPELKKQVKELLG